MCRPDRGVRRRLPSVGRTVVRRRTVRPVRPRRGPAPRASSARDGGDGDAVQYRRWGVLPHRAGRNRPLQRRDRDVGTGTGAAGERRRRRWGSGARTRSQGSCGRRRPRRDAHSGARKAHDGPGRVCRPLSRPGRERRLRHRTGVRDAGSCRRGRRAAGDERPVDSSRRRAIRVAAQTSERTGVLACQSDARRDGRDRRPGRARRCRLPPGERRGWSRAPRTRRPDVDASSARRKRNAPGKRRRAALAGRPTGRRRARRRATRGGKDDPARGTALGTPARRANCRGRGHAGTAGRRAPDGGAGRTAAPNRNRGPQRPVDLAPGGAHNRTSAR